MTTEIQVRDHGPLLVRGPMTVTDATGKAYDLQGKESVALCRCGHSKNKPFCDGSHKGTFESECRA